MSDQIREQVSAFLDGELPNTETELLLKRLTRDGELRESFGRYALIGEALRGGSHRLLAKNFGARVNLTIDGEPVPATGSVVQSRGTRWWRPFAGTAVVAGVAAVAIVAMQQRSVMPGLVASGTNAIRTGVSQLGVADVGRTDAAAGRAAVVDASVTDASGALTGSPNATAARNHEAISYTVPVAASNAPIAAPAGRLTNYMFAHSKYSNGLAQRGVLTDLLVNDDEPGGAAREPVKQAAARAAP